LDKLETIIIFKSGFKIQYSNTEYVIVILSALNPEEPHPVSLPLEHPEQSRAMATLSVPLSPPSACLPRSRRPAASDLNRRLPSRPTLAVCLATKPKVPLPIASPSPLGNDPAKWDPAECDALLRGGEQVASVLQEMLKLVQDLTISSLVFLSMDM
jgi:hypothetical protein